MLKKYDKVKEEAIALLLDKKNYQENTEEDRKLKNIEDPYARTTNVKDKNINIQSDDNSDLKIKLDTEEQKIQLEGVIGNELSLDNISSETTEELKKLKQLRNEGTITYIKSNVAIDLKKMLTYEFLDLPIQFIKQFDVLYNFNINVD
jgi:S-adenosylhomocysteine hydrolase